MTSFHFYPPLSVSTSLPAGISTEAKQDDIILALGALSLALPLPNGAATESKQDATIAAIALLGGSQFEGFTRVDPAVTAINDSGYTEIIATAPVDYKGFKVFQQGGNNIIFALGDIGSEVDKYLIHPGDLSEVRILIPAGTRISLKSLSGTVNATQIIFNWLV